MCAMAGDGNEGRGRASARRWWRSARIGQQPALTDSLVAQLEEQDCEGDFERLAAARRNLQAAGVEIDHRREQADPWV